MDAYGGNREHLLDHLDRLDLLLRRRLAEWRAENAAVADRGRGLYVADEEVDALLASGGGADRGDDALDERIERRTDEIREREAATREADGDELRLAALTERFDLSPAHRDALVVALAPDLDEKYETVYAYLQDDVTRRRPTVGTAMRVLAGSRSERLGRLGLFARASPLRSSDIVRVGADDRDAPLPSRPVAVDPRVVAFLLGRDSLDPALADAASVVPAADGPTGDGPLADLAREKLAALDLGDDTGAPDVYYFRGAYGSGVEAAVEAACHERATRALRVDAGRVEPGRGREVLRRARREARMRAFAIQVANPEALAGTPGRDGDGSGDEGETGVGSGAGAAPPAAPAVPEWVVEALDAFEGTVFLTGEPDWRPRRPLDAHEFVRVEFEAPDHERRRDVWERRLADLPGDVEADPSELAATFALTPGEIDDAVATARSAADGGRPDRETLYRACRRQSRRALDAVATPVETTRDWSDIVLPADRERKLRELAAHVRHRGTVYADWGFAEKFGSGNGINALFVGPSGTGKTMAAEILAGETGLDLYRVDLATVVSKYVGETEKRLRRVFDEAADSDVVLFFDEADALFGERSAVRDSHDRYANVEVSYLLQRMEDHDGTVLLASNLAENIDDAFQRRLDVTVEFPRPDEAARREIWEGIFPADLPRGEVDLEFLASFDLAGGNIGNAALAAAALAADDGGRVEMAHLVKAVERELQKTGRIVDPDDFGEYRGAMYD